MMLGRTQIASQIEKLAMKALILSETNTNARRTPFIMRPPATIRNSRAKLNPYDV